MTLATLPTEFDTPMFWSEDELSELAGTAVVGLLGLSLAFLLSQQRFVYR